MKDEKNINFPSGSPAAAAAAATIINKGADPVDDVLNMPAGLAIASEEHLYEYKTLQSGSVIKGRFRLEKEIGRGGMGVVYTARDLVQEEIGEKESILAIKLLSDNVKKHPDALRMLQQECKKVQSLAHPNIVTVYDFDRDADCVYMTMEFLNGHSLQDYLEENQFKPIAFEKVASILSDVVAGLDYAHRRNIIHSDLKPGNIFLTQSGAKILDFGIARALMASDADQTDWMNNYNSGEKSSDNFVALTPSYASLEMFMGAPPDVRDDIYGLACIVYELLTGKHPYGKKSAKEAFEQQLVLERVEGLKEWQWTALRKGLALKRDDRTGNATDFLTSLLPRRKEPWKWVSYFFAVIAVVSAGYFFFVPDKIVEPDLFSNPLPAAVLSQAQQQRISDIIEIAEVHMMVGRLVSPPGGNALDEYRKVLEIDAYNRNTIAGLSELLNKLVQQARISIDNGNFNQAAKLIQIGLEVHNKHEGLIELNQRLGQLGNN